MRNRPKRLRVDVRSWIQDMNTEEIRAFLNQYRHELYIWENDLITEANHEGIHDVSVKRIQKQVNELKEDVSHIESVLSKDLKISGSILCMVHFFLSKTNGFALNSMNDEKRFRQTWPSFKPSFKSVLELYNEYKAPDFKISLSTLAKNKRADHHNKKSDRSIVGNLIIAIKHLEIKNDTATAAAKESLSSLKLDYYKRYLEDYE